MKRLILCALLLSACSGGQKGQSIKADSLYHYGDHVSIVDGQYKGCAGDVNTVIPLDDDKNYNYDVSDLECSDSSRHEHTVQNITEKQLSK